MNNFELLKSMLNRNSNIANYFASGISVTCT